MTTPPPEQVWLKAARARGLTTALGVALDVLEPLGLLGAQALWFLQPVFGVFGARRAVGDIAGALEQPGGVARLRRLLDEIEPATVPDEPANQGGNRG